MSIESCQTGIAGAVKPDRAQSRADQSKCPDKQKSLEPAARAASQNCDHIRGVSPEQASGTLVKAKG